MNTTMTTILRQELTELLSNIEGTQPAGWLGYQDSGNKQVDDFHYLGIDADPATDFKLEPLEISIDAYNCLIGLTSEGREDSDFHEARLNLNTAAAHLRELLEEAA